MNDRADAKKPIGKALVLDFGGVVTRTLFETQDINEKALGVPPGSLNWRGPFDPVKDSLWRDMQAGKISERDYWMHRTRETGRLVGEDWTEMKQLVQRLRNDDPNIAIRPEALSAIDAVARAGLKLAVLSNELDLFYGVDLRKRLTCLDKFEVIVDATYTGILKPDPRAYGFVTKALNLEPVDCVFVDDQPKNVAGGIAAGMQCVQFDVFRPAESYAEALGLLGLDWKMA